MPGYKMVAYQRHRSSYPFKQASFHIKYAVNTPLELISYLLVVRGDPILERARNRKFHQFLSASARISFGSQCGQSFFSRLREWRQCSEIHQRGQQDRPFKVELFLISCMLLASRVAPRSVSLSEESDRVRFLLPHSRG